MSQLLGKTHLSGLSCQRLQSNLNNESRLVMPVPARRYKTTGRRSLGGPLKASNPDQSSVRELGKLGEKIVDSKNNVVSAPESLSKSKAVVKMAPMDGNEATAHVAYAVSDVSFIYPITPSTPMGESADAWAAEGKKNVFGNVMSVTEMESETGAAGAVHGALAAGSLTTTFTCSQGLLLMIPNMYKIAGELMPCVMHVTARALAKHALSILGDHQDVMAVRQTGWGMLCSHSVQEAQDLALVAHLATLRASVPFVHFFDGFRTSHEINKISIIPYEAISEVINRPVYQQAIRHHQQRALNPTHPHQRGTAQGPDVYFQCAEASNPFYNAAAGHVVEAMKEVSAITGRTYNLFDYVGHPQAEHVVVMMGSGSEVTQEAVNYLVAQGKKVGLLKVRLFRPWSTEHFIAALPVTASRITVLDRTKEPGALGDPLYLEVFACISEHEMLTGATTRRLVIPGRYGLASKDYTPAMAVSVYENMALKQPKRNFTVGIVDDVTFTSLPVAPSLNTLPPGTQQCMFWGMGSDGTVGANKEAIKIIADNTNLYAQAYFSYDAHKSGGVTVSHLRFGPQPIGSSYLIEQADYLAVHHQSYMQKYDVLSKLRPGGVLLLNSVFTDVASLETFLPAPVKRRMAELQPQLYVLDARQVADTVGLGKRINMVMQTAFFHLSGVMPMQQAIELLKKSIAKAYGKKGPEVVAQNQAAVDDTIKHLKRIDIPASWAATPTPIVSPDPAVKRSTLSSSKWHFIEEVAKPMLALEGDNLPVSVFGPDGFVPPGTTVIERRAIAASVPVWKSDSCTQCNICSFVCPHAAIRPSLAKPGELGGAPETFQTLKAKGAGLGEFQYRIQVSPFDCTGCNLCVQACPDNALVDTPINNVLAIEDKNWSFARSLPERVDVLDRTTVKGSQFMTPLMEFSGACEGCGETTYVKLLTQLFGERLIIANATGCSSIWGGSAPSNPYTTNEDGYGPAWANSLFEDNAQFGLGIAMGTVQRRKTLSRHVQEVLADSSVPMSETLKTKLGEWSAVWQDASAVAPIAKEVSALLEKEHAHDPRLERLYAERDMLLKPSIWIVGGDGWAYDIGYGGLDHVMSTGEDINILVLDTEMYSNTGGQKSKSTPLGAVTKFAAGGKTRPKKDLGAMAMGYGDVYVASTCLQSNYGQVVKAMSEAEKYGGVSLVLAYAPCVMHGIEGGMCHTIEESKEAVETGYWPLYRYNPSVLEDGTKHRFQLDSKKLKGELEHFLHHENRFNILDRKSPETATRLHHDLDLLNKERFEHLKHLAETDAAAPRHGVEQIEEAEKKRRGTALPMGPGGQEGPAKPSHFT
mmetsp:Transcript_33261/g.73565  ORF Transcript_33261/g.73565 Transcript_33261/m.73565 type:complete len:1321 (+) Transcript_33261:162-4124(+)|eukprot:CAMPEP_0202897910 /NCGR_PEP_ID=MMETSP1392-20130828/6550_1 /ASSEMBLY_ACC=CAM_ASM_000868 /TAXON_ID=225041 /ORGANISM="Chlamydomonas chlamydogama, Strain SAG 11-48b" /LENGTH=1320 /DNA_ID=CAMNT_0049583675 /DNA_START=149 /DNA_END=4111 /DNA_ORIENTATION=-